MKDRILLLLALILGLIMAPPAAAQSAREQLQQITAQLQNNPSDSALREKIIKLARTIKPAPAIPEQAREYFVAGSTIAKAAQSPAQQQLAVAKFAQALTVAPWWGDAYYNLAVAQELAGQFEGAKASLKLYILTEPGERESREAQDRIYALTAKQELAAAATPAKAFEGARFAFIEDRGSFRAKRLFDVRDNHVVMGTVTLASNDPNPFPAIGQYYQISPPIPLRGLRFEVREGELRHASVNGTVSAGTGEISADGKTLTWTEKDRGEWEARRHPADPKVKVYVREN